MNKLLHFFGSRPASAFCLLFALANRIVFTSLYSTIGRDTMVQLTYAENLMFGKGMGVTKYFVDNPGTPVFDKSLLFPPGYSFSIIPFLKIFRYDEYFAVFAHDILSALLFILAIRFVGRKINLSSFYLNILTLVAGCSQYPFFMSYSATDTIGLSFLLFALGTALAIAEKKQAPGFLTLLWVSIIFYLPALYRFMYLPVSILIPILLFLTGFISKNKIISKAGLKSGLIVSILIITELAIAGSSGGAMAHISLAERGFYPGQILHYYPFVLASFVNLDFAAQQFVKIMGKDYRTMMSAFEIINVAVTLFLLYLLIGFVRRQKRSFRILPATNFICFGSAISLSILIMLTYLTLTYRADFEAGHYTWTFLYDNRYYAFIYCFVQLLFFLNSANPISFRSNKFWRAIWIAGVMLLLFETSHGIYYNAKIISDHKDIQIIKDQDNDYKSFTGILSGLEKENRGKEIIVSSPDQFYLHKASLMGYKAFFDYTKLNIEDPSFSDTTILLMPVYWSDQQFVKGFMERVRPTNIRTVSGTNFYVHKIYPQPK